jgi:hypothetical protein
MTEPTPPAATPPAATPPAATPPAATPPAASPPASPPAPAPANGAKPFDLATLAEPHQQLFASKKWGKLEDAFDSYVNLEKRVGANTVIAPTRGETTKFFADNKDALGVPDKAEGYEYAKPELPKGMEWDAATEQAARAFALERNIPGDLFKEMMDFEVQSRIGLYKDIAAAEAKDEADTKAALDKAWGADLERNTEIAKAVPRALGLEEGDLEAINGKIESPVLMKLFHKIGELMGEDQLKGAMEGSSGFGTSAMAAKAEIDSLKMNKDFQAVLNNGRAQGHAEALAKWEDLHKRAFPGPQAGEV